MSYEKDRTAERGMHKSVYSLVLADEIVRAVDRLAYAQGTSRSNLINQVLAEYCSFVTPEKRMKDIFRFVEELMNADDCFQVRLQPSDAMLSIRSALAFKYKPTIRYAVELYRAPGDLVGELRVSLRTQSERTIELLTRFFTFWAALEQRGCGRSFPGGSVPCTVEEGRFRRQFRAPARAQGSEEIGQAIAGYIQVFDQAIKLFFDELDHPQSAAAAIESVYAAYLAEAREVI